MKYENVCKGIFIARPNRFVAVVSIAGKKEKVHVKNTGRCRELLIPGAEVYLQGSRDNEDRREPVRASSHRKTRFSLYGVKKGSVLVNIDSWAPNRVCEEALLSGKIQLPGMGELSLIKREKVYGNSRFDFYIEDEDGRRGWIEVKGVTLEEGGTALFPDAPTVRGVKHINELSRALSEGYRGFLIFVIQMAGTSCLKPNDRTHKAFGDALREAENRGVAVLAYDCAVTEDSLEIRGEIPVICKAQATP